MTTINGLSATEQQQSTTTPPTNPNAVLDKDGFLKLFMAQLQHQDPSSPMDANESMQQMATFTMVEQLTNLTSQNSKLVQTMNTSSAVGLIGRTVTYLDSDSAPQTGKVESVATSKAGATTLTVDGATGIDPKSIIQVA
jgi:flagellar basal-body rod modification protein FlgD